ncbi:MAG: hypothetical protein K9L66_09165, partial [Spirochaetaceae bacterium]|nr:hypothetical protein [Spirochaetaceae bacterium]MCF7951685.1 hypothetical protein [Spirochaetaceae bacterium]
MNRSLHIFYFFCIILIFLTLTNINAQSLIPKGSGNWIQVTGDPINGDRDSVMVAFFEVPDTVTSTLYFAINSPGLSGAGYPDQGTTGTTIFRLFGGQGAISDSRSRQNVYTGTEVTNNDHLVGTLLDTKTYGNVDLGWEYFAGVEPTQGEKIGNKYYFRVVAQIDDGSKNGFQLDVSTAQTTEPSGHTSIKAFAYGWTLALINRNGQEWNIYPFVADTDTGNIRYHNHDADFDSGNSPNIEFDAFRTDTSGPLAVTVSGENTEAIDDFPIYINPDYYRNGTWRLRITERDYPTLINTTEFWFSNTNSGEIYRGYSDSFINPPAPDYVSVSPAASSAKISTDINTPDDTERIAIQLVDIDGNPVTYSRNVWVTLNQADAGIVAASDTSTPLPAQNALVTTSTDGLGWVDVARTNTGTVTVTPVTDGSNSSSNLTNTYPNETAQIDFSSLFAPVMSSAANLYYIAGNAQVLEDITIDVLDDNTVKNGNEVYIRIPTELDAHFDPGATISWNITGTGRINGAASGSSPGFTYTTIDKTNDVIEIPVSTDFVSGDTMTISGLAFTNVSTPSEGNLRLSYDGGGTYTVVDDKLIVAQDGSLRTWVGGTTGSETSWNTASNWDPAFVPTASENVLIPDVVYDPVLDVNPGAVANISLDAGASLDLNGNTLRVVGDIANSGTIDTTTAGSTLELAGTSNQSIDIGTSTLRNLTVNKGGGTATAASSLILSGNLTRTQGALDLGANDFTISGNVVYTAGSLSLTGALAFTGGNNQTVDLENSTLSGLSADKTSNTLSFTSGFNATSFAIGTIKTFNLEFNMGIGGDTTQITNAVTFDNTGSLTFGNEAGDSITFDGGLSTTAVGGVVTLAGSVLTSDAQMDLGAVTLGADTVLDTGTAAASVLNLAAVTGAGFNLSLDAGANAAISGTSIDNVGL